MPAWALSGGKSNKSCLGLSGAFCLPRRHFPFRSLPACHCSGPAVSQLLLGLFSFRQAFSARLLQECSCQSTNAGNRTRLRIGRDTHMPSSFSACLRGRRGSHQDVTPPPPLRRRHRLFFFCCHIVAAAAEAMPDASPPCLLPVLPRRLLRNARLFNAFSLTPRQLMRHCLSEWMGQVITQAGQAAGSMPLPWPRSLQ